ncbi:MAG: excinuclease ATPase subunit [Lachnospiraceae bacterium]|nr:excinuclease ATPase subunit [Lachnospiraceae bacterium]
MTYGCLWWYYECPNCGHKFKYGTDQFEEFGEDFGKCPKCSTPGKFEKEGAIMPDDKLYEEC